MTGLRLARIAAAAVLLPAVAASAKPMRFVDHNATGANTGMSWTDAFTDLQAAIAAVNASGGAISQLWVADGVYKPSAAGNQSASFALPASAAIYGGFAGGETSLAERNPVANLTVLSGDLGDNDDDPIGSSDCCTAHMTPSCDNGACAATVCALDSFCCSDRWDAQCAEHAVCACGMLCSNRCDNSYHVVNASGMSGAGLLDGFTITGGFAFGTAAGEKSGGGAIVSSGSGRIVNCVLAGNEAEISGGAVYISGGAPAIRDCRFEANGATSGGAIHSVLNGQPKVVGCTFTGNQAQMGAGYSTQNAGTHHIISCRFYGNSAEHGAAVHGNGGFLNITNCLMHNNTASASGGAIRFVSAASGALANCTIANNVSASGGGVRMSATPVTIDNCILWGNTDQSGGGQAAQVAFVDGPPTVRHSLVQGLSSLPGFGNIAADPKFVDPDGTDDAAGTGDDNYGLMFDSSASDAGRNGGVPADAGDVDGDLNVSEVLPLDLAGGPRFVENPQVADTGGGTSPIVDIGALEQGDCNGNGVPDAQDVANGTEDDCNDNLIPDVCEYEGLTGDDCDENEVLDSCQIADNPSLDLDDNGVLDVCQDCNNNTVPDFLEIIFGTAQDCNHNAVPDECDTRDAMSEDCQADDVPDECQLAGNDCDGNQVPDDCDIVGGLDDCDANLVPDDCEADFDNDGQIDACDGDIDDDGVGNAADACDFTPLGTPVTPDGSTRGDVDADCDVDVDDFLIFGACWQISGPNRPPLLSECLDLTDLDGNGVVDMRDFVRFQRSVVP